MSLSLRPLADLRPDADNPREASPERLALVRLSLAKLGFLLPLVATPDGLLLSGHQRAREARRIGLDQAPVLTVAVADDGRRRGLNILLNRATNDFRGRDVRHGEIDAPALARRLAALPDTRDPFPCLAAEDRPIGDLLAANPEPFDDYMASVAGSLLVAGVAYPLVVDEGLRVLNGAGRLCRLAVDGAAAASCVVVPGRRRAAAARLALNALSMDFAFAGVSADLLRYNAFRRARLRRKHLGSGFVFPVWKGRATDFDLDASLADWRAAYGGRVLDFGAGHGDEAAMLAARGIDVLAFEPFPIAGDAPDPAAGRASARALLRAAADGRAFSSVVLSSVLNSVPFAEDRAHLVAIVAALCRPTTTVFAAARGDGDPGWRGVLGGGHLSAASRGRIQFPAEEPGTLLGDLRAAPKIQKFHAPDEFKALFEARFEEVTIGRHINNVTAICRRPRPIDRGALRDALVFEFDLPYPDGSRMGLAGEAIAAFSRQLGVTL